MKIPGTQVMQKTIARQIKMIFFFAKKYLLIAFIVASVLFIAQIVAGFPNPLVKSVLFSGFISGWVVDAYFAKMNYWVLYYNARFSRWVLVVASVLSYELLASAAMIIFG